MHVFTESELAEECQRGMMEFLLINHPLDCPICDRGGECQLQRYSMEYGQGHSRMHDPKRKFKKPQLDPLIDIERNRCIMCTRCVRFSDEVAGEHVMGVFARGNDNYIGTFGHGPVSNILSGNVIDICPVGCLTSKPFRFKARPWELHQTQSTSIWDSSGAKVTYWMRGGHLYRTTPPSRKNHDRYTINEDTEEFIDNLTRFGSDFPFHEDRWDESRVRIGSTLLPGAFVEAVRQTAEGLSSVKETFGPESVAVVLSPRLTMEEGYLAGKFARTVLGNDNVDWRMSFLTSEAADATQLAMANADGDLENGFDAVIVLNGDYLHTVPVFASRVKEYARLNQKPVIMIGHHHDRFLGAIASQKFYCKPGETAKALKLVAQARGGDESVKQELKALFGCCDDRFAKLWDVISRPMKKALVIQNLDDMNGRYLPEEVPAALALKNALGEGWKYLPTLRARNAFGFYAVGAQPGRALAYGGEKPAVPAGISARDLVEKIEAGQIKAVLCLGADTFHSFADQGALLGALDKLEFFALSDLFGSTYAEKAHVFFAAASHLEKNGTMCDLEGNLARISAADEPIGGSRPEWELLTGLANMMGATNFNYESVEDVFKEMMGVIAPEFRGSFRGLMLAGPTNDVSVADPGGARRLSPEYNPGDYRVDGAHFRWTGQPVAAADVRESRASAAAPEGQFLVTWGKHTQGDDWHLNRSSIAKILQIGPYAEVNVMDAFRLDIEDHAKAILRFDGLELEVELRVCQGPAPGTLYLPSGLGGIDMRGSDGPRVAKLELLGVPVTSLGSV
jgi:NADH-quinone oxidoreductase subunit G